MLLCENCLLTPIANRATVMTPTHTTKAYAITDFFTHFSKGHKTMTTAVAPSASDIQREARNFVQQHVYCNVGMLVDYSIKKSVEDSDAPISYEELGLEVDPSEWDAEKCRAYLADQFDRDWEYVTDEPWLYGQSEAHLEEVREWIQDNYGDDEVPAIYLNDDGTVRSLDEWSAEQLHTFINNTTAGGHTWEDITGVEFETTVADEEDEHEDELDKAREYIRDNADPKEVYEWWAISDYLACKLKEYDSVIVDGGGCTIWGRETTGQAIYMDGDIQEIVVKLWAQQAAE